MTATKSFRFRTTRRSRLFSSGGPNVMLRRIVPIVYLLIGALVASQHGYLSNLATIGRIVSAALAIVLWPLILFGLHLSIA